MSFIPEVPVRDDLYIELGLISVLVGGAKMRREPDSLSTKGETQLYRPPNTSPIQLH